MRKSALSIFSAFAASLVAAGCSQTASTEGAGFVKTKPRAATIKFMVENDRQFATDTATNNRACDRAAACLK